ncbi:VTT domain-containing protein [Pyrobaculum ferrireducens]|uniref:SNARE associated Golgi protein-like protein n=1 Tax=Pyrobaculum ferrireducens TaxID=1104324 RepID=G7VG03_9CREN|nr:VTT domain-containing protein [Pyrobaculum ferrireducens]AET33001.1 SNARE associated Golgi protein-like protein [Pyrobaculum ferrireducens]
MDALGPLGVFLAVFISHVIPFAPLPGYAATIYYVSRHNDSASQVLAAVATALGASLGKLVVFLYGYGIGKLVARDELLYAKRLFEKISKLGIDVAVFIFAMSPLADDVLYIPLGAAGYHVGRFFTALFAGKMVLATLLVFWANLLTGMLEGLFGNGILATLALVALTAALTVLVLRIKWSAVLEAYEKGGVWSAVKAALRSVVGRA